MIAADAPVIVEMKLRPAGTVPRMQAQLRAYRQLLRELGVLSKGAWLDDVAWPFPTWAVRARPFDWAIDA